MPCSFFRPAFLEEFEKLEIELKALYKEYVDRARCVAYLEQVLDDASVAEQERMQKRQVRIVIICI